MGRTGKKSEPRERKEEKSKRSQPAPPEDDDYEDGDIATPKRDRCDDDDQGYNACQHTAWSAEIFALDEADAFDIEQMRAPASSRQRDRLPWHRQQKDYHHQERHGADPVEPHGC
jgi:hypothetical protein